MEKRRVFADEGGSDIRGKARKLSKTPIPNFFPKRGRQTVFAVLYSVSQSEVMIVAIVPGSVLTLLAAAVWMDMATDRISNRLILLGLALGASYQVTAHGAPGLAAFLCNIFLPVLLFYLMYRIRALGAGDLKLLSLFGGFLATNQFLQAIGMIFAAAALIGLLKLLYHRILITRLKAVFRYAETVLMTGKAVVYDGGNTWENRIHFSVAVLLGAIWYYGRCYFA